MIDVTWYATSRRDAFDAKARLATPNSVAVTQGMLAILTPRFRNKVFRKFFRVLVF